MSIIAVTVESAARLSSRAKALHAGGAIDTTRRFASNIAVSAASRLSSRAKALHAGGGAAASVWEKMNAIAARAGMVNMSQGFPDFPGSSVARDAASVAMATGDAASNQYSPQPGLLALRESVSAFYDRRHGVTYDPASEVVVTAGGQEGLAAAFLAYLNPGDEVVCVEPFYPFMLGAILNAGAIPRVVTLEPPDFALPEAALREACASPKAKMLVLNTPHNPTGKVATPQELEMVASACVENDLLAVADEVYEHCVFPSTTPVGSTSTATAAAAHRRLAAAPGMAERTITIGSGGKLFALTGWRVAWATGPAELLAPLGRAHTHMTFSAPTPLQLGVAAALDVEDGLEEVAPLFASNWRKLATALEEGHTPVAEVCAAEGGYFLVARTDGTPDVEFCENLAESAGVVATPMSVFYTTPFTEEEPCTLVRFTICKSKEHVERACERIVSPPHSWSA